MFVEISTPTIDLPAAALRPLVDTQAITTHFQPIFSVRQKCVVGMEALSRGVAVGGGLIPPSALFKMAASQGLSGVVEDLCRKTAIRNFGRLNAHADELLLFLNLELGATEDHESLPGELDALVRASGLLPRNVAVEFLEARLEDIGRFGTLAAALRKRGFLVVLDDVGTGHSNLDRIPLFRPDVIKVDRSLVSGVENDFYKQETLKSLVSLSRRIGALVVAEGVETEQEAITALELGADLLQGFFLSRPQPVTAFDDGVRAAAGIERLARNFKDRMVKEISERKGQHRRNSVILDRIVVDLAIAETHQFDRILTRVIADYPKAECLYVLDDAGTQVTETICNATIARRRGASIFRPAPRWTDHSVKEYYYGLIDVELQKYTTDPYGVVGQWPSLPHHQHGVSSCERESAVHPVPRREPIGAGRSLTADDAPRRYPGCADDVIAANWLAAWSSSSAAGAGRGPLQIGTRRLRPTLPLPTLGAVELPGRVTPRRQSVFTRPRPVGYTPETVFGINGDNGSGGRPGIVHLQGGGPAFDRATAQHPRPTEATGSPGSHGGQPRTLAHQFRSLHTEIHRRPTDPARSTGNVPLLGRSTVARQTRPAALHHPALGRSVQLRYRVREARRTHRGRGVV